MTVPPQQLIRGTFQSANDRGRIVTAPRADPDRPNSGTSKFLSQAGVRNTHLRLEQAGLRGNGHMMMLGQNSAAIADMIGNWLEANIK